MSYQDEDGLTLTEAAAQLGVSRNSLKKRCDRKTVDYFIDSKGARRVPIDFVMSMGQRQPDDFSVNIYDYEPKFDIPKAELWGNGKAPVVDPSTNERWEIVIGVSDIHVPWHDPILVDAMIELAEDVNPHRFVINGDTNDFFGISRYNRALERLDMLEIELEQGKMVRRAIRNAIPNAVIEETLGNHEERLLTYPGFNAPALRSLSALKPANLFGLHELEIRHWPTNGFRLRDDFLVEHGHTVSGQSGATARKRLDATLISGVMGHVHRLGEFRRTGYRDLAWFEGGCLCMLNPDYVPGEANWKQGFWIGQFSTKTNNFNVELIPSVGRGFIFSGKHYGKTDIEADPFVAAHPTIEIPSDFAKEVARTW